MGRSLKQMANGFKPLRLVDISRILKTVDVDVVQTDWIHTLIYLKISITQLYSYNPTDSYLYYIFRRIAFLYFYKS